MKLILSWTCNSVGGSKAGPCWGDVESRLDELVHARGTVTLDVETAPDGFHRSLQVRADLGKYLLTLGEEGEDDWTVRAHRKVEFNPNTVEVLGDLWSASMVFHDFAIVRNAFKEFLEHGNVGCDVLQ